MAAATASGAGGTDSPFFFRVGFVERVVPFSAPFFAALLAEGSEGVVVAGFLRAAIVLDSGKNRGYRYIKPTRYGGQGGVANNEMLEGGFVTSPNVFFHSINTEP